MKKIELVSPAGNLNKLMTALAFGADAVYLGIPEYSLRSRINEFTPERIRQAVQYAHSTGKKVYVTINIFPHNSHFKNLPGYIRKLKGLKADGLIISDPGVLETVKKIWPKAGIHLSTQANCINKEAARFWRKQGVQRIILGRETKLSDIKKIKSAVPGLELECFVHGAMCMAYSGRCFLSKYLTGRSANLGDCIQPCRWKYDIKMQKHALSSVEGSKCKNQNYISKFKINNCGINESIGNFNNGSALIRPEGTHEAFELLEENGISYILNSKDLCLIKHLDELAGAGVTAFKIEGRTKSDYYAGMVTGIYRRALDISGDKKMKSGEKRKALDGLFNELAAKTFHRGFTTGFLFEEGKHAQNTDNSHKIPNWEFCGQVAKSKKRLMQIKVHNSIYKGDTVEIIQPHYGIIKMKISKMIDAGTGEEIEKAHGGRGQAVIIESKIDIPEFSLIRRKIA